jgi:UDP-glucose 4-epimerase
MGRCLVIGGGLLGGTVAWALGELDHQVVVFSRSFGQNLGLLHGRPPRRPIRTIEGSVSHGSLLRELVDECDVVFYFAGGSTPAGADTDAGGSVELSVVPATTVLELMRGTSTRRIVLASSGGTVYGEPRQHPTPEDHITDPIGIHGHNALTVERYAGFFARRFAVEPVILRIATAYGPGQRTRRGQGVICAWIDAALAGAPLRVYGSLDTRRDFVFAADVAAAAARTGFDAPPGTYNVGSGSSHSLGEVIGVIGELADRELDLAQHAPRGVDVRHTELDCSRLKTLVDWVPVTSLRDGLRATWEWSAAREDLAQRARRSTRG